MGIFTAILGGLSSAASSRATARGNRDAANLEGEWGLRSTNASANQDRETLLYSLQLEEAQRQNRRREVARGSANYRKYATMPEGYTPSARVETTPLELPKPRIVSYDGK